MKVLAILIWLISAVAAVYVGLYLLFIRGIIQIVNEVNDEPVEGGVIAWGVVKILFASFLGWLTFLVGVGLGIACWNASEKSSKY